MIPVAGIGDAGFWTAATCRRFQSANMSAHSKARLLQLAVGNQRHYLRGEAKEKEPQNAGGDNLRTQWRERESAKRNPCLGQPNAPGGLTGHAAPT